MTDQQEKAAKSLQRALDKCNKAGLQGGVFDGSFCLWSRKSGISPHDYKSMGSGYDFFKTLEEICGGVSIATELEMDGGAGN